MFLKQTAEKRKRDKNYGAENKDEYAAAKCVLSSKKSKKISWFVM